MQNIFFSSRTAAREAAKVAGVKPIDNGKDSAPGKRWSIQVSDCFKTGFNESNALRVEWENKNSPVKAPGKSADPIILPGANEPAPAVKVTAEAVEILTSPRQPSWRRYPFQSRSTMVQGSNGRKIPVEWRQRHTMAVHS